MDPLESIVLYMLIPALTLISLVAGHWKPAMFGIAICLCIYLAKDVGQGFLTACTTMGPLVVVVFLILGALTAVFRRL